MGAVSFVALTHENYIKLNTQRHIPYKCTDTTIFTIVRRFPTTFRRFLKILLNLIEGNTNVSEHFTTFSEDYRRLPNTFKEDPKMFRSHTNKFKYSFRVKHDISEVIMQYLHQCDVENTPPESRCCFV